MKPNAARSAFVALGFAVIGCGGSDAKDPAMVTVAACNETLTACGGDIVGTWRLTDVCLNGQLVDALNAGLADFPSCSSVFTSATMETNGSVSYTATTYTRSGTIKTSASMKLTASCFAEQLRGAPLSASSCSNYQAILPQLSPGTTATCSYDGTSCNCDTVTIERIDESNTYSISASTITETGGTTYQYCVNGAQLKQSGVIGRNNVSGVAHLTKQP